MCVCAMCVVVASEMSGFRVVYVIKKQAILEAAFRTQTLNLSKSFEQALHSGRRDVARNLLQERSKEDPMVVVRCS